MNKYFIGEMVNYDYMKTEQVIILSEPTNASYFDNSASTYKVYSIKRGIFLQVQERYLYKTEEADTLDDAL